jgi:hypothetical protein
MQKQSSVRRSSGAKAIALNERMMLARYRLLLLLSLLLSAAFSLELHLIFGR